MDRAGRGDIHDQAGLLGDQQRSSQGTGGEVGSEADVDQIVPRLQRNLPEPFSLGVGFGVAGRVVDQDVEAALLVGDSVDHGPDVVIHPVVAAHRHRRAPQLGDLVGRVVDRVGSPGPVAGVVGGRGPTGEIHGRPVQAELHGDPPPDAPAGSGDQCDPPGQIRIIHGWTSHSASNRAEASADRSVETGQ